MPRFSLDIKRKIQLKFENKTIDKNAHLNKSPEFVNMTILYKNVKLIDKPEELYIKESYQEIILNRKI